MSGAVRDALTRAGLVPLRWIGRGPVTRARRLTGLLAGPLRLLMRRRGRIVRRNLELCFPDWSLGRRRTVEREHFRHVAEMLGEIACAWFRAGRLGPEVGEVTGLEHLERARADGRGVMLLTGHVTCLELGGRLFGERVRSHGHGVYRPLRNPVLEAVQCEGRARYTEGMIRRDQPRAMIRHLRAGGVIWYAPDQDLGPERSHFAPFFGIPTATATGILELARLGRARVVPMYPLKDPDTGRVTVVLEPAFESFPSDSPEHDLARFNAFLERWIRRNPAQYWWLHRRFKTRPEGDSGFYCGA